MIATPDDWDDELDPKDPEDEYQTLLRSLRWTDGFGMLFVQCSPAEADRLITRVKQDLPQKRAEVLNLTEAITNLYDLVDRLPQKDQIQILFIKGIEHSLLDYEEEEHWDNPSDRYTYSWKNVPPLLGHLNLSRERFRDNFPICFIFLVPLFALKYLIRRAPDFFDWRSGIFTFPMDKDRLRWESFFVALERFSRNAPINLTPQKVRQKLIRVKALLDEPEQTDERRVDLFFEQGRLFEILERCEDAIESYEKAIDIKPDYYQAWYNRGVLLANLGRYEAAIKSYKKAVEIKPDFYQAWFSWGDSLFDLGHYEEAIENYKKAIGIKPDLYEVWDNQSAALLKLGRAKEALLSCNEALVIKPDFTAAYYNKACAYGLLGRAEEAIVYLDQAIELEEKYREMAKTDPDFDNIRDNSEFRKLLEQEG